MEGLVIVEKGLEEVSAQEIKEKTNKDCEMKDTVNIIKDAREEDICRIAYTCQSIRRALLLKDIFKVSKDIEKTGTALKKAMAKLEDDQLKDRIVSISCERIGEHDFSSVDITKEASDILRKKKVKVSRDSPDIQIYIYIHKGCGYLCIDFSGKDLGKREYRVFTKASSIKGTLAYSLLKISGYKPGEIIVDPSSESGEICIESALMATNKPVHFYRKEFAFQKLNKKYDKILEKEDSKIKEKAENIFCFDRLLSSIHSAKKNAKIAGVDKAINFSKTDIEWLDTKFEKESVDRIITKLPSASKRNPEQNVKRIYKELAYQAEYVLKKNGLLTICTLKNNLLKEIIAEKKFKVKKEKSIFSGQQKYTVTIFKKFL